VSLSAEAWLMLLALVLYVYDAAMLLASDELVLVHGRKRWFATFGANGWKLNGKEPFVPNLLAPWRGLVRLRWSFEQGIEGPRSVNGPKLPRIGVLPKAAVTVLLLLIFIAFPLCLFAYHVTTTIVLIVVMIYGTCFLVLAALRREWAGLGLDKAAFWKLCAECITCPPFCINAVRKASLTAPMEVTLADVAEHAARHEWLDELKQELVRRVEEQISVEAEGSERMARLEGVASALGSKENA
jgi:hypothetical protein